jgi:hypothetical protein
MTVVTFVQPRSLRRDTFSSFWSLQLRPLNVAMVDIE